jgi:hexosaminidase
MMKSTPSSSNLTKVLAALCGLTAVLVLSAGTASAQYNVPATVTANTSTPSAGGPITLTAEGFGPGTTVQFSVESTPQALGSAVASSSGVATLTTTLPANLSAGAHTIRAVGTDPSGAPLNVTTTITVAAAGATTTTTTATSPTGLAATGSSSAGLVRIGVVIAVLGGLLLLAGKRQTESV